MLTSEKNLITQGGKFYVTKEKNENVLGGLLGPGHVGLQVHTSVSEEHTTSIFRAKCGGNMFPSNVNSHLNVHTSAKHRRPKWTSSLL
jgi:hypothetical protein